MDDQWTSIMQEVDRLYHLNQTSEGRIACITDYIVRRETKAMQAAAAMESVLSYCLAHGYINSMAISEATSALKAFQAHRAEQ